MYVVMYVWILPFTLCPTLSLSPLSSPPLPLPPPPLPTSSTHLVGHALLARPARPRFLYKKRFPHHHIPFLRILHLTVLGLPDIATSSVPKNPFRSFIRFHPVSPVRGSVRPPLPNPNQPILSPLSSLPSHPLPSHLIPSYRPIPSHPHSVCGRFPSTPSSATHYHHRPSPSSPSLPPTTRRTHHPSPRTHRGPSRAQIAG